ncbi:MAG: DUF1080 domain-containing protein [Prevotellaceae bacterium]|jgi:hypothetical protein|nr:DUF1080 domain-containing protein [Prevotellaceae bacterium]
MNKNFSNCFVLVITTLCIYSNANAQKKEYPKPDPMTPNMTEFWTPQPKIVTPGKSSETVIPAPSDAIVLFDGKDLSAWEDSNGNPAQWVVKDGIFTVKPGSGSIQTKQKFENFQLHIEWRSPETVKGNGQGRGNSGVFFQGIYELQVLDSYDNETYANGMAGSIYKQTPPLVNAMRKPGEWNTYDVIYSAPVFKNDGTYRIPPTVTVLLNGIVIQNNTTIRGTTPYIGLPETVKHGAGPLSLQDHGDLIGFRNIWIREL